MISFIVAYNKEINIKFNMLDLKRFKTFTRQELWFIPIIPTLKRVRQEDHK
jgi:hypothetical protein